MQLVEWRIAVLHASERRHLRLREWVWVKSTKENLRTCNTRAVARLT